MQSEIILGIEVRLLIVKYGYARVIETLAAVRGVPEEEILELIEKVELGKKEKAKKRKETETNVEEIVEKVALEHPEKSSQIKELAVQFNNKRFLPELKDVRRFLDKQSVKPVNIKSRVVAAKQIFRILGTLSSQELSELIKMDRTESDFSILSDQIIGKSK